MHAGVAPGVRERAENNCKLAPEAHVPSLSVFSLHQSCGLNRQAHVQFMLILPPPPPPHCLGEF